VRSLEFQLNVLLLRQPDAAVPARSEMVLDSESYRYLSMDRRHSRYIEKVIGTTWTLGGTVDDARPPKPLRLRDRRSEGESRYVRIYDLGKDVTALVSLTQLWKACASARKHSLTLCQTEGGAPHAGH